MSEQFENLEARLSRLRLRPISTKLEDRIALQLDQSTGKSTCPCHPEMGEADASRHSDNQHPDSIVVRASRPRDRWLWSAITSGAIAACVIIAMLIGDTHSGIPAARLPLEPHMHPENSSGTALASAAQSWGDELGPASFGSHP